MATALSNDLSSAPGGRVHKRDLNANDLELLSQLSIEKLAQIAEVAAIPDKTIALAKLQQLLQHAFPGNRGRTNFDDLAEDVLNHLNYILPQLKQQAPLYPY